MNSEIELKLLKEIKELRKEVNLLKGKDENQIPTYRYSQIRDTELKKLFEIKQKLDDHAFDEWFNHPIEIDDSVKVFLTESSISIG